MAVLMLASISASSVLYIGQIRGSRHISRTADWSLTRIALCDADGSRSAQVSSKLRICLFAKVLVGGIHYDL